MRAPAILLLAAASTLVVHAQEPAGKQPPVFRAGIDVVVLDVSVLDRDRRPVRGLTAADFTVLEDGKPRPIVAFTAVDLAARVRPRTAWLRDVPSDVVTNAVPEGRLVVFMFDRSIPFGWPVAAARRFAVNALDELRPGDLAAVIHTGPGRRQNFTADRSKLLAAIEAPGVGNVLNQDADEESGECFCGVCSLEAITRAAEAVGDVPHRRKSLVFLGAHIPTVPVIGDCEAVLRPAREAMFRAAQAANLTVHAVDVRGLETLAITASERPPVLTGPALAERITGASQANAFRQDTLRELAAQTGGRAVINTNAPEERSGAMFDETTSYYLIGIQRMQPSAKISFHPVDVRVRRRNVTVRARRGYYDEPASRSLTTAAADRLSNAGTGLLPNPQLPLRISVAPFALEGSSEAAVTMSLGVGRTPNTTQIATVARFFDTEGQPKATLRGTVDVPRPTRDGEPAYEVVSRLDLEPGQYELRLTAEQNEPPQTGSVYAYVDVPDFARLPLSMSGLVLEATPALPVSIHNAVSAVVPVTPTSVRAFLPTQRVSAFVRVYQRASGPMAPVTVEARLVDDDNRSVVRQSVTLPPDQFAMDRAADYRMDVPIGKLKPGEYLLTIDASLDAKRTARRQARFSVAASREHSSTADDPPRGADDVLRAAAAYLAQYEREISAVVAEEHYLQTVSSQFAAQRVLRSDLLVIRDAPGGWLGFRDVYEVDRKPVRDRDDRLVQLFLKPNPDPLRQARRIVEESTRYNLNAPNVEISRSINMPFTALKFLLPPNQSRSRFAFEGIATVAGLRVAVVRFAEQAKPRVIASPDNAAATGTFWIEPDSGRIVQSELTIATGNTRAMIRVSYAQDPRLKLWLPMSMDERYVTVGTVIEGKATYSNFRRFGVATETIIK